MDLNSGLNILVGDNEAGKSTLLQAIDLCLNGRHIGRSILDVLNNSWINASAASEYVEAAKQGKAAEPPEIIIECHLMGDYPEMRGTNHDGHEDVPGVRLRIFLDPELRQEYEAFVAADAVRTVPTEFYTYEWHDFAGSSIPPRRKRPYSSVLIDPRIIRLQAGTDYYLRDLIQSTLNESERAQVALTYRLSRDVVADTEGVKTLNAKVSDAASTITSKSVSLALDETVAGSWSASLVPHLDSIPLSQAGQGEQSSMKILLAIMRENQKSGVLLLEEPENHLSHARLNELLQRIQDQAGAQQVIVATHSSFVLNKLDIGSLKLLNRDDHMSLTKVSEGTRKYFRKLSGYDTLRIVCCRSCILVEGPSDELMIQRFYSDKYGHGPLADGIEVLSVQALAFARFVEIASGLKRRTAIVTDNDGKDPAAVIERYTPADADSGMIRVFVGAKDGGRSLEHQIVNASGIGPINKALGRNYSAADDLIDYMTRDKAETALRLFDAGVKLTPPEYIRLAIEHARA